MPIKSLKIVLMVMMASFFADQVYSQSFDADGASLLFGDPTIEMEPQTSEVVLQEGANFGETRIWVPIQAVSLTGPLSTAEKKGRTFPAGTIFLKQKFKGEIRYCRTDKRNGLLPGFSSSDLYCLLDQDHNRTIDDLVTVWVGPSGPTKGTKVPLVSEVTVSDASGSGDGLNAIALGQRIEVKRLMADNIQFSLQTASQLMWSGQDSQPLSYRAADKDVAVVTTSLPATISIGGMQIIVRRNSDNNLVATINGKFDEFVEVDPLRRSIHTPYGTQSMTMPTYFGLRN